MRPRTLDEIVGQQAVVGPGSLLRRMLAAESLGSIILYGPPGTGKTTLARLIAGAADRPFEHENAASVGVPRIREIIAQSLARVEDGGKPTVLFLDEIHRFSRSQQDVLLGDVERGVITLVGATTENPLFAINSALISRSTLLRLEPLSSPEIVEIVRRAVGDRERGLGVMNLAVSDQAIEHWATVCDGDARRALLALEIAARSTAPGPDGVTAVDLAIAQESIQHKAVSYDHTGDEHYDAASALIKSVRGSDPDAALYWLATMLEAHEDPRFIIRRLAILASEDIGNADPRGIMVAQAAWELVERLGMPEARITLGQLVVYLSLAPKSNASYLAIDAAIADVRSGRSAPVPSHVQDSNVKKAQQMGGKAKGQAYQYAHDQGADSERLGKVGLQDNLGTGKQYLTLTQSGFERELSLRLAEARALRERGA